MAKFMKKLTERADFVFGVLTLFPFLTLAALYSYIVRARIILGYWPSPGNPPYPVGSQFHAYIVVFGAAIFMPLALIAAVITVFGLLLRNRRMLISRSVIKRILIFAVLWLTCFLLLRLDPGHFLLWLWD